MTLSKTILWLTVLLLATAPLALAQGTYKQIDVPGSSSTACYGIDSAGNIAGSYSVGITAGYGFYLSGGSFTTISDQGQNTLLGQLNDVGQIVGHSAVGFVYDLQTQIFTDVHDRNGLSTMPTSINNAGTIVGYYYNPKQGDYRGFELVGSAYSDIDPPGSATVMPYGIGESGTIFGFAGTSQGASYEFSYNQGTYQKIHIPSAPNALAFGVNPAGSAIVGVYVPSSGILAGFVYQNRTLTTLEFPGSSTTIATAINKLGEVVGYFFDANNVSHGFTWTPPAAASEKK